MLRNNNYICVRIIYFGQKMQQHEMRSKTVIAKNICEMPQESFPYFFDHVGVWLRDKTVISHSTKLQNYLTLENKSKHF